MGDKSFGLKLCCLCDAKLSDQDLAHCNGQCKKCRTIQNILRVDKQYEAGQKFDQDKPRYSLVPSDAMAEYVNVLTFGANKYSDDNWKMVDDLQDRYYNALQRHLAAYRAGDKLDDESGLHHLAHAMCCLSFMLQDDIDGED